MDCDTYLERARRCLQMARTMREEDQLKMPNIAEAWLELANDAAAIDLRTGIDVRPRPPPGSELISLRSQKPAGRLKLAPLSIGFLGFEGLALQTFGRGSKSISGLLQQSPDLLPRRVR